MTTKEAAEIIGITPRTLRQAIVSGRIVAKRVPIPGGGFAYDLSKKDVKAYRDNPTDPRGWQRGRSRK